jgi:hypothetical protein
MIESCGLPDESGIPEGMTLFPPSPNTQNDARDRASAMRNFPEQNPDARADGWSGSP